MLTIVCPVVRKDINSFKLMLKFLHYHLDLSGIDEIIIVTPRKDKHLVSDNVKKYFTTISIVEDEEIIPFQKKENGWIRQQIIKLLLAKRIHSPFYLILDADIICSRYFSSRDLIKDGKAAMHFHSVKTHFKSLEGVCKLLVYDKTKLEGLTMCVTPAILSTKIVTELLKYLQMQYSFKDTELISWLYRKMKITSDKWITEYELYYVYAHKKGLIESYHFSSYLLSDFSVWKISDVFHWNPQSALQDGSFFCVYQSTTQVPPDIIEDQVLSVIQPSSPKEFPLISCLMITKNRLDHVKISVQCFLNQTYPKKELLIICDADDGVQEYVRTLNDSRIRHIQLEPSNITLGDLRNFSVEQARGDYIAQWDDDDWYHPSRLSIQYAKLKRDGGDICMLSRWTMAWPSEGLYAVSHSRKSGWEGSMLVRKKVMPKYPSLRKFEDTELIEEMKNRRIKFTIIDGPGYHILYLYLVHGNNTWGNDHFKRIFTISEDICKIYKNPEELSKSLSGLLGLESEHTYKKIEEKTENTLCKILWFGLGCTVTLIIFVGILYLGMIKK